MYGPDVGCSHSKKKTRNLHAIISFSFKRKKKKQTENRNAAIRSTI